MKTLSLQQFTSAKIETRDHQKKEITDQLTRAKEISQFHPCEVLVIVSEQDGELYFEHTKIKLEHKSLDMEIRYWDYQKRYVISCRSIHGLKNITTYTVKAEQEKMVEPKNIGVLTAKKIQDWIKYYEQLYKSLEVINNGNDDKEAKFLESLKGHDVKFYNGNGKKQGEIIKNGIKFSFTIEPTYISQKIEVYYECESNLETFLKLSDNKYKGKKK